MRTKRFIISYAILCICFFSLSCKKEKAQSSTETSCRIITGLGGPDTYHFTYNTDGKLSSLLIAPGKQKVTYTYKGDTTIVLYEVDGKLKTRNIITNNAFGFATNIRRESNQMGTVWTNQSIAYNGTQLAKILYSSSDPNGTVQAVNYTWKNGNIATMESGGSVISFEYYTDRPSAPGEWRRFTELVEGYRLYDNKNLTKSLRNGTEITDFKYEFDAAGKIIKTTVIEAASGESSVQYEYACN